MLNDYQRKTDNTVDSNCSGAMHGLSERGHQDEAKQIAALIDTISNQQPEALKVIE